jgi:hypothetical protein
MLLLALALAPVLIDPAHCRQEPAALSRWQTDGRGTLTVSTEARFQGEVLLRCRVKFSSAVSGVTVDMDRLRIAFRPAALEGGHSGVSITIEPSTVEFVQVSREDWIEAAKRSWRVDFAQPRKQIDIVVRAIDDSNSVSMRVDLRRLQVTGI